MSATAATAAQSLLVPVTATTHKQSLFIRGGYGNDSSTPATTTSQTSRREEAATSLATHLAHKTDYDPIAKNDKKLKSTKRLDDMNNGHPYAQTR